MPESVSHFLVHHCQKHSREPAFVQRRGYRRESFSYGQVLGMARRFAAALASREIVKGDRVMLWGPNCAQWVACFLGCALRGVIVVPMDDAASVDFASRVFNQVQGKLLIASRSHLEECARFPSLPLEAIEPATDSNSQTPDIAVGRDDILQIVFTSGTTAEPRGVVISHANVLTNVAPLEREIGAYLRYERFVHPLRFLNLLPLSHVFGQFLGMYLPPLLGATVIFQDEMKPSEIVNTIRRERVSVLVSVPRVLQSVKQKVERDIEQSGDGPEFKLRFKTASGKHFLRRWWTFRKIHRQFGWKFWAIISGGAALDQQSEEFWGRLGFALIQGYGLTETTSLISVNHPFRLGKGSIGKVLPGRELKLADDGEILVRGGGVASGYWENNGARSVADEEGCYRTGDVGELDAAGNLYFKGRKKEVIVTPAGMKVYPEDLEAALRRQAEVKDCVVIGLERGGNAEPCAVLILRDETSAEAVVSKANESLADFQRIHLWVRWPEEDFPRTNTQKPKRNVIAEFANAASSGDSRPVASANESSSPLSGLIRKISGRSSNQLSENASLDSDLGLSSLDRVELLSALEDRYQVDLSETRFSTVKTVGEVERMLRGEAAPTRGYHYPSWVLRWPITWLRLIAHYLLMRPAVLLLGWPRMIGRENLRGVAGPLLVVANHIGDVDPGFILTALPPRLRHRLAVAAGGEALEALRTPSPERNWFGRVFDRIEWILGVSLLNLFPLPREAGFRRSFAYAGEAVDRGYSILVFPEGRHTKNGVMNPFRAGVGLLAQNLGIPVLPMRIDGLFEVKASGKKSAAPHTVTVRIGHPIIFPPETDAAKIALDLENAVQAL